jgi:hypothetical protein
MESIVKGAGRAMIEHFQSEYTKVTAVNAVETAQGFYLKFGFDDIGSNGYAGQINMTWWAE